MSSPQQISTQEEHFSNVLSSSVSQAIQSSQATENLGILLIGNTNKSEFCNTLFGFPGEEDSESMEISKENINRFQVPQKQIYIFGAKAFQENESTQESGDRIYKLVSRINQVQKVHIVIYLVNAEHGKFDEEDIKLVQMIQKKLDLIAFLFAITGVEIVEDSKVSELEESIRNSIENAMVYHVFAKVEKDTARDTGKKIESNHDKLIAEIFELFEDKIKEMKKAQWRLSKELVENEKIVKQEIQATEEKQKQIQDVLKSHLDDATKNALKQKLEKQLQQELEKRKALEEKLRIEKEQVQQSQQEIQKLEALKTTWIRGTRMSKKTKISLSVASIKSAATVAGFAGFSPVPFADIPIQVTMVTTLATIWGIPVTKAAKSVLPTMKAMMTRIMRMVVMKVVFSFLKFVPLVGQIISVYDAYRSSVITNALGIVYSVAFGTLVDHYEGKMETLQIEDITQAVQNLGTDPLFQLMRKEKGPRYILERFLH